MNWQAIGAIGELLGGVVVVASLVFLAIQIRRNTQALQLGVAEETNRSFSSYLAMFTQPGVSRVYRVGLASSVRSSTTSCTNTPFVLVRFMADLRDSPSGGQQDRDFIRRRERARQRVATEPVTGGSADLTGRCLQSTP